MTDHTKYITSIHSEFMNGLDQSNYFAYAKLLENALEDLSRDSEFGLSSWLDFILGVFSMQ